LRVSHLALVILRDAAARLADLARFYPVVSVTGPRQSGKTTLCRATFPDLPYVSLEPLDVREFATADPRGFLASLPNGAIIDEVQRTPDLFSYLQTDVDHNPAPGRFILTGSQQLPPRARSDAPAAPRRCGRSPLMGVSSSSAGRRDSRVPSPRGRRR
jgi:hypothetical protein